MRWMNRLATAMLVIAVVTGPPLLAGVWLAYHPWRAPTRAQIVAWAEQPLTPATIITACLAVAGLAWLLLLTHLAKRAATDVRRRLRRMRYLPVPTPAQMTAGSMAGIAAFTLPTAPAEPPQPLTAIPGTPQPSEPPGSAHHADRSVPGQPSGIALPGGGWLPYRTAAAITTLAAALWLQRRRAYRPDPARPHDHHADPELQPLPDTVALITAAVTDTVGSDRAPPLLPAQQLPTGILLLTGPGAAAAARGLLVEAALSDTPTVSVRLEDLNILLPPGDQVKPTVAARTVGADERTVVVLGEEPVAATHRWYVAADGLATGSELPEPRRLCCLDPQATADLLALIRGRLHQPSSPDSPSTEIAPSRPALSEPETVTTAGAHLTLFGGCDLTAAGKPIHIRRTASLQILAYLAISPHGATRGELTHAIWPHLPPATISQRLHTTLADLRRQLRPVLTEEPITRSDDRYRLNLHAIGTDLQQWRTAVHTMTRAVGITDQLRACRAVIATYRGDLAGEHTWSWLAPVREQARRTVVDAYVTLADHTDPDQALTLLRQALGIDPYNEALHHQAARLLHAAGDHAGAADLIKRLHDRIGYAAPTRIDR